jgi:hypothetical protein
MKKNVFLGLFLLMMGKAYSQIVYTPVNPNFEINLSPTGGSSANLFPIDFNNDGVVDFNFRWDVFGPGTYFMHITSSNSFSYNPSNQAIGTGNFNSFGVPYAMPLSSGVSLSSTSAGWITEPRGPLIGDGETQNFLALGDRYIGVRFLVGSQYYYGWILVSFTTNKLTIKSYAYQSTPNASITTGNTGGSLAVGDHHVNPAKMELYPNPASEFIKLPDLKQTSAYEIYNAEGRIVKSGTVDSKKEINISELLNGSYIISVMDKDQQSNMKFIKK